MRAIESGRWLLQAAPTGFSAVIDPAGHVRQATHLGERAVLAATVDRRTGRTPYTALGDGPVVVVALLALAWAWALAARGRGPEPAVTPRAAGSSAPR